MNSIVVLCFSIHALFGAAQPAFPEEIGFLNQVPSDDENKVVDAVRQYVLLQYALSAWDQEIAQELQATGSEDDAKTRLQTAQDRLLTVEKAYKVLIERYPKNARAVNYYGEFLYDYRGDHDGAVRYWREAIADDANLALPYNNLGIHYSHEGQLAFGLENYKKALELDPKNPDFKFNLAQTYLINTPQVAKELKCDELKVYKEGMKLSKEAAELKPTDYKLQEDYATNFYAADRFEFKPDWADAAAAWKRARAAARSNEEIFFTWLNEGRAWIRKPDKAKAEAALVEALKVIPDNAIAKRLLERVRSGQLADVKAE